jgi:hypothetical protein
LLRSYLVVFAVVSCLRVVCWMLHLGIMRRASHTVLTRSSLIPKSKKQPETRWGYRLNLALHRISHRVELRIRLRSELMFRP